MSEKFPPLCEVCNRLLEDGVDLEDDCTISADCCERCGLCHVCREPGAHDCDDDDPDDEQLPETPADVIEGLGFDPLELAVDLNGLQKHQFVIQLHYKYQCIVLHLY